jgi:hypothetical protein
MRPLQFSLPRLDISVVKISPPLYNTAMATPKITIVGQLRYSETDGLKASFTIIYKKKNRMTGKVPEPRTVWLEAMPTAYNCPGIPPLKDNAQPGEKEEYFKRVHAEPSYREAASKFLELQRRDPQPWLAFWIYRDHVLQIQSNEPESLRDTERDVLLVKHYVLSRERRFDKIQREIEALENLEKLESVSREPIAESVRLFVWQRDKGQCVKCGSQERLEFDHIIPVVRGGSNTERNIQLLCEPCNRSKGANV